MITVAKDVKVTGKKRSIRKTGKLIPQTYGKPWEEREYKYDTIEGEATLTIDVEALISLLGPRAISSKGRKAVEAGGAVVLTVTKARVTEEGEWRSSFTS